MGIKMSNNMLCAIHVHTHTCTEAYLLFSVTSEANNLTKVETYQAFSNINNTFNAQDFMWILPIWYGTRSFQRIKWFYFDFCTILTLYNLV